MSTAPVRVAAAVIVEGARVLVQTRPSGAHYEGYWEFPGGKLEAGETVADCAVRECREELCLDVVVEGELTRVDWTYVERRVHVTFLDCSVADSEATPSPQDEQIVRWATAADLDELRFLPANDDVLTLLRARLSPS